MSLVNCLTDRGRGILEATRAARELAAVGDTHGSLDYLANAIDLLVMAQEPLWEKRRERVPGDRTVRAVKACRHNWRPYTLHKAKCSKCGHACPWTLLLKEEEERFDGAVLALRDVAKATRALRRSLGDGSLGRLLAILSEAGVA